MYRRLNVTLPEDTARLLNQVATKGARSRLIAEAIRFYVRHIGRETLRRQLREGAMRRAERDITLTREWFPVDEEAWRRSGK